VLVPHSSSSDLGDRIFMSGAESINPTPNVTANSWFVEGMNQEKRLKKKCCLLES